MTAQANQHHDIDCGECQERVTVVHVPEAQRADTPHWAELYVQADANYQLCWKCGKVLWSPLEIGRD